MFSNSFSFLSIFHWSFLTVPFMKYFAKILSLDSHWLVARSTIPAVSFSRDFTIMLVCFLTSGIGISTNNAFTANQSAQPPTTAASNPVLRFNDIGLGIKGSNQRHCVCVIDFGFQFTFFPICQYNFYAGSAGTWRFR